MSIDGSGDRDTQGVRRFVRKLFLFLLIPFVIYVIWVIISPINLYTFRAWESVSPYSVDFSGPFYPNQRVDMIEVGDLAPHTDYAIPKQVTFITDSFGYRFDAEQYPSNTYDVVIVGDSMTVGSSLTQTDTLFSVLSEKLNQAVYPLAPADLDTLLSDERFSTELPEIVILQRVEREIDKDLCPPTLGQHTIQRPSWEEAPLSTQISVIIDRILRESTYFEGYLRSTEKNDLPRVSNDGMVFLTTSIESPDIETVPDIVESLQRCHTWFAEQGVVFIFVPVPDRENIYFDKVPDSARPSEISQETRSLFLGQLIRELRENNITVIDTLSAYTTAREEGIQTYQMDDTHWNAIGVEIVADLIMEALKQR